MNRRNAIFDRAFLLASLLLTACGGGGSGLDAGSDATTSEAGSDGSTADGGGITAAQACQDQATARCNRIAACEPFFGGVSRSYPDMATCIARNTQVCMTGLTVAMTAQSPAHVETCAQTLAAESCAEFRSGVTPMECRPPAGSLANGAPCVAGAQCASAYCVVPRGTQCGACAPQPVLGDACATDADCGPALACSANNTCQTPITVGGSCDLTHPCAGGLACVRTAADAGAGATCQTLGSTVGAPCNFRNVGDPACDFDDGLFCDATNHCAMATQAAVGAACGIMGAGASAADCTGGATCEGPMGSKVCVAPAMDGAACDTANGPVCLAPARCVITNADAGAGPDGGASTSGVCRLFDPGACM